MKDVDSVSDSASNAEFDPGVRKIPWSREWQPTPVFLSGEFHREVWQPTVQWVTKSQKTTNTLTFHLFP